MPKLPIQLPPGLEAAAAALQPEVEARDEALKAAVDVPLPGPVADVFAGEPITVGPLTFRDPTLGDVETLRLIGSPYYGALVAVGLGEPFAPDPAAVMDAAYLWTTDPRQAHALARKGGALAFREEAAALMVDAPIGACGVIVEAIAANLRRAFGTAPPGFSQPPANRPASDGGLKPSEPSPDSTV